jgi:hypothetical protein
MAIVTARYEAVAEILRLSVVWMIAAFPLLPPKEGE